MIWCVQETLEKIHAKVIVVDHLSIEVVEPMSLWELQVGDMDVHKKITLEYTQG